MSGIIRTISVLFFSILVTGAFAQQRGGGMRNADPEANANRQLEQLKGFVKIDKKEETKLKEIFLNGSKEQQKAFESMGQSGDREVMRAKMQELNKKRDAEVKKILGEKRFEKYSKEIEKIRQQRRDQRRY